GFTLAGSLDDPDLKKAVAYEQGGDDPRLDRLFVFAADDEPVHHGVHVAHRRLIELDILGNVHRLAVYDEAPAPLLAHLGEDEVQVLAVDLPYRRPQLDLHAL